jgi:hypothetical protein
MEAMLVTLVLADQKRIVEGKQVEQSLREKLSYATDCLKAITLIV